jgi:hypothetical protein
VAVSGWRLLIAPSQAFDRELGTHHARISTGDDQPPLVSELCDTPCGPPPDDAISGCRLGSDQRQPVSGGPVVTFVRPKQACVRLRGRQAVPIGGECSREALLSIGPDAD